MKKTNCTSTLKRHYIVALLLLVGLCTLLKPVAGQVSVVAPVVTAEVGNNQVNLSWFPVQGASSYNVYRATETNAQGTAPYITGVTTLPFRDKRLVNGVTYYYKVTAVSGAGNESAASEEVSAIPQSNPPTNKTAAQVVQRALNFLTALNIQVSEPGVASAPGTLTDVKRTSAFYSPIWIVRFGGQVLVEVADTSDAVTGFTNMRASSDSVTSPPTGNALTSSQVIQSATTVLQAAQQNGALESATASRLGITPGSTVGDIWFVKWQRTAFGYPYRDQHASVAVQDRSGLILSSTLMYSSPPPGPPSIVVTEAQARAKALQQLASSGVSSPVFTSAQRVWVRPNTYWQSGGSTIPSTNQSTLAWICTYTVGSTRYEVWVSTGSVDVVGGIGASVS